jgi:hypothetical protein
MTDDEGILRRQPSGRWAVCLPGRQPVEIPAGEIFLLEVPGARELTQLAQLEGVFCHFWGWGESRIKGLGGARARCERVVPT